MYASRQKSFYFSINTKIEAFLPLKLQLPTIFRRR